MLSETDRNNLLKDFPNVELSYETIVHKKVYNSDIILAIPEGKKYYAWFTTFKTQNVCIMLETNDNKKICRVEIANVCFHDELSYGTIVYGTMFKYDNTKCFSVEDIYYYKGKNISTQSYVNKLTIFKNIFSSEIKQLSYFDNNIIFGLPLISNSFDEIVRNVDLLPYKIKYIQFRFLNRKSDQLLRLTSTEFPRSPAPSATAHSNSVINMTYIKSTNYSQPQQQPQQHSSPQYGCKIDTKREIVFKVTPDIQNDIYNLCYYDNKSSDNLYDVAYIPDYKTSVMMNKLFRNIKENANLDALEESDDETEFENESPDKFVHLDRSYNMTCVYNLKFRKWTPVRVAPKGERIITKNILYCN